MNNNDRTALTELELRIKAMERRLYNAKAARDSYLDFLRNKYPLWKPATLPTYRKPLMEGRDFLVNELATSEYHWDLEREEKQVIRRRQLSPGKVYNKIPPRGPLLDSDVVLMKHRLHEISESLRVMREHRMNMSTEDYFRSRPIFEPQFENYTSSQHSISELRRRLEDIDMSYPEPAGTPTREQLETQRKESEQEKMINDIREGRIPTQHLLTREQVQKMDNEVVIPYETIVEQQPITNSPSRQRRIVFGDTVDNSIRQNTTKDSTQIVSTINQSSQLGTVTAKVAETVREKTSITSPPLKETMKVKQDNEQVTKEKNDYAKMMDLLNKADGSDSSDSDSAAGPSFGALLPTQPSKPQPNILSQYLGKVEKRKTSVDSIDRMMMNKKVESDSDSDFFG